MDLNSKIETEIILHNNTPLEEFSGLTPNQMQTLLYDTFGEGSPIQFRKNISDETLDKALLFRISEELLKIVQREKHIKLTKGGALPRKVVIELYEKKFIPEEMIDSGIRNLLREDDSESISLARVISELAGFIVMESGKIILSPKALEMIDNNDRIGLFKKFFETFTEGFHWGNLDNFTEAPIGQVGWAYSLLLLNKFGEKKSTDFYVEKYARAFPMLLSSMPGSFPFTPELSFSFCYNHRVFDTFFPCFGFVTFDEIKNKKGKSEFEFRKTDVIQKLFKVEKF
ncbi:MAG: hypothetical protein EOO46_23400 [Flavobacterium sp.]|nr:MAG: hypothetical protein EOO46_23400 [Flavobacterium sp.]